MPQAVDELRRERGLDTVIDGPDFAAVGDHDGMIILVTADREWFPTDDRYPNLTPLQIALDASGPPVVFSNGTVLGWARPAPKRAPPVWRRKTAEDIATHCRPTTVYRSPGPLTGRFAAGT